MEKGSEFARLERKRSVTEGIVEERVEDGSEEGTEAYVFLRVIKR